MGFFDKLKSSKSGYIFISHSHDDIEKVREIRNKLERDGFEPLCFYLKCLNDDSEIEELIKREIDAREWFLYVDSDNSRKSKWVNKERAYIEKTDKKKILTVNIDDAENLKATVDRISHNLRVFISCSAHDVLIARRINQKLIEKDFLTFFAPDSIYPGEDFVSVIGGAITQAAQEGCVLFIVSERSLKSALVEKEIAYAIEQGGRIIPVTLGSIWREDIPEWFDFYSSGLQWYSLSDNPTDEEIERMVEAIGTAIVSG